MTFGRGLGELWGSSDGFRATEYFFFIIFFFTFDLLPPYFILFYFLLLLLSLQSDTRANVEEIIKNHQGTR